MAVTNYHTVNGEIIGETTVGSPRVDYLTDALGSVTATVNQSGSVVNTYRYNPFGSTLAKTGTGADPSFGWVGTKGYRPTTNKFSDFYVLTRHASDTSGAWPTRPVVAIGIVTNSYMYALNAPTLFIDPTGNAAVRPSDSEHHILCTGCKPTDPICTISQADIQAHLCGTFSQDIGNNIANLLLLSQSCACDLTYKASVTVTVTGGCFESESAIVGNPLAEVCRLSPMTVTCASIGGSAKLPCAGRSGCPSTCGGPKITLPSSVTIPLTGSPPLKASKYTETIKLSITGSLTANGTITMHGCVKLKTVVVCY